MNTTPTESKKIPFEFKSMGAFTNAERAKVFGGWLVTQDMVGYSHATTTFVPDKNHEWEIE